MLIFVSFLHFVDVTFSPRHGVGSDALWPKNQLTNHIPISRSCSTNFRSFDKAWIRKQDSTSTGNTPHRSTIANVFSLLQTLPHILDKQPFKQQP